MRAFQTKIPEFQKKFPAARYSSRYGGRRLFTEFGNLEQLRLGCIALARLLGCHWLCQCLLDINPVQVARRNTGKASGTRNSTGGASGTGNVRGERCAAFDVAKAFGRIGRADAERDHPLRLAFDEFRGVPDRVGEHGGGTDRMIGRHDGQRGVRIVPQNMQRRQTDARRGVAFARFAQDRGLWQLRQLLLGRCRQSGRRGDDHSLRRHERRQPIDRLLQQRALAGQRQELLRTVGPAFRPEPRPRPAGHDDGMQHRLSRIQ